MENCRVQRIIILVYSAIQLGSIEDLGVVGTLLLFKLYAESKQFDLDFCRRPAWANLGAVAYAGGALKNG